jgi:hypothetical protein
MYHGLKSPANRRNFYLAWIGLPVVCLLGALIGLLAFSADGSDTMLPVAVVAIVSGLLISIFYPARYRSMLERNVRRMYSEGSHTATCGRWRLIISKARLSLFMPLVESHYQWQAVERIERTPQALYIYITAVSAVPIPARAFATASELDEIEQAIRARATV